MANVYLETTFFSFCATQRTDAASVYRRDASLSWWENEAARHSLFISAEVIDELEDPRHQTREQAMSLALRCQMLPINDEVLGFAEILVAQTVMPGPARGDAIHVSACCLHGIRYLLSWNVRHLANANKADHLAAVCRRYAVSVPTIITPDMLGAVP